MELIGVIGGMSWESTAEYLRLLNQGVRVRLGGLHSARLRVATVDFARIEEMQARGAWVSAGNVLAGEARALQASGASLILIATNTMHKVYDQVAGAVSVPVLHLGDVTADAVTDAGLDRVALLATRYTMEQDFYRDRLATRGVASLVPDETGRKEVQRIIYEELCVGRVESASRDRLLQIAGELVDKGAQGVVLGCTELELSIRQSHLDVPVFPTTRLHCEAALDAALGRRREPPALRVALDHCVVRVTDWERSDAFYRDVLGAVIVHQEGVDAYRFGTQQLNVHGPGKDLHPLARVAVPPRGSDLCFRWDVSPDEVLAHLHRHGTEPVLGPTLREGAFGRGLSVYFRDPDGSLLEIITYAET